VLEKVLIVSTLAVWLHLAYDDFKERAVWDWEVGLFTVLAGGRWFLSDQDLALVGLALYPTILGIITMSLNRQELFPMADALGLAGSILLAPNAIMAGTYLILLAFFDMAYRLRHGFAGLYEPMDTPLLSLAFVTFVGVQIGWWLV